MPRISIDIPEEMVPYAGDLEYFMATMVRKLHTNRHKGTSANLHLGRMMVLCELEIEEAIKARQTQGQFEFGVECADIANFAFLAARSGWNMTREEYEKYRNDGEIEQDAYQELSETVAMVSSTEPRP